MSDHSHHPVTARTILNAGRTIGQTLHAALWQLYRDLPDSPVHNMRQAQQQAQIEILGEKVDQALLGVVTTIAAGEYPAVSLVLEQVVVKDGVKITASLSVPTEVLKLLQAGAAAGSRCMLVMVDPKQYQQSAKGSTPDLDQPALPFEGAPDPHAYEIPEAAEEVED